MSTPTLTDDLTIDDAIEELHSLKVEEKSIKARIADLEKIVTADAKAGAYLTSQGTQFRVTIPRSLNKKRLAEDYPRDHDVSNEQLYKTKHEIDLDAVRAVLGADDLEDYYEDGKAQVRL